MKDSGSATPERGRTEGRLRFASLMLGHPAQGLAFTVFTPALASLARDFNAGGQGALIAQLSVTIAAAGLIVGAFSSGWIVQRFGARNTVLAATLAFGAFGSGGMFLQPAWALLASRAVVGLATACLTTACISTIAALYEGAPRARLIGASTGMGSALGLIGLLAGGALAQAGGWRLAFVEYPVFGLIGFVLAFAGFRNAPAAAPESAGRTAMTSAWTLWPVYALSAILMSVIFMGSAQFAFLLPQDGVRTPGAISLVMSTITLLATVTSLMFGVVERRLGARLTLVAALGGGAAALALIGLVVSASAAVAGAALLGVFVGLIVPYMHNLATSKAAPAARVKAIGLLTAFNFLGALLNPFIFSPIGAGFGLHGMFLIVGAVMTVFTIAALAYPRAPPVGDTAPMAR